MERPAYYPQMAQMAQITKPWVAESSSIEGHDRHIALSAFECVPICVICAICG